MLLQIHSSSKVGPDGLKYLPDFITRSEENGLIAHIRTLPLAPFQFGNYEGKRRVVYYGARYDFTHQRLESADSIPEWLEPMAERVEISFGLQVGCVAHALVTEYNKGAGIGWHRDKKEFDEVFGISLGSACKFRLRRTTGSGQWERFTLDAQARSLYAMTGQARHVWEHSLVRHTSWFAQCHKRPMPLS